jgi:hypothetical protein
MSESGRDLRVEPELQNDPAENLEANLTEAGTETVLQEDERAEAEHGKPEEAEVEPQGQDEADLLGEDQEEQEEQEDEETEGGD